MEDNLALTVITAPSCAGKDYLSRCLFSQFPEEFEMVVSSTTRSPRDGEKDGVDYWFLNNDQFEALIDDQALLEHVKFGDKYYGTSAPAIKEILNKDKYPVLIVEPMGAINIWNWCHKHEQSAQFVFINVDRDVALSRFLERFITDYEALLDKNEDNFLDSGSEKEYDFDVEVNDLIARYSKRIYLSMYKESHWKNALPYSIKLRPLLVPENSVSAASLIKEALERGTGYPDHTLSEIPKNTPGNPKLRDMPQVIKNTLSLIKKNSVNEKYLKTLILKCENERLNQIELGI